MVAAGAGEVSREGAIHKWIGTFSKRHVRSSLGHGLLLSWREDPAAWASQRVRADLGPNRVGVQTDLQMVGLRADVAHLKHQVPGDLPFDRKAPVLDGGRVQGWIQLAGLEDRAGGLPQRRLRIATGRGWRSVAERRNDTEQRREERQPGVERWVAAERLI